MAKSHYGNLYIYSCNSCSNWWNNFLVSFVKFAGLYSVNYTIDKSCWWVTLVNELDPIKKRWIKILIPRLKESLPERYQWDLKFKRNLIDAFDFSAHHHFTFPVGRQVPSVPPVSQSEGWFCYNHVSSIALSDMVSPQ